MSLECEHGQLARSCNICEYEREIAELTARVGELEAENKKLMAFWEWSRLADKMTFERYYWKEASHEGHGWRRRDE